MWSTSGFFYRHVNVRGGQQESLVLHFNHKPFASLYTFLTLQLYCDGQISTNAGWIFFQKIKIFQSSCTVNCHTIHWFFLMFKKKSLSQNFVKRVAHKQFSLYPYESQYCLLYLLIHSMFQFPAAACLCSSEHIDCQGSYTSLWPISYDVFLRSQHLICSSSSEISPVSALSILMLRNKPPPEWELQYQ